MYEDRPGEDRHTLHYKAADQRTWSKPGEVEVFVFPRYNWWNNIVPIKTVDSIDPDDPAGRRGLVPDSTRRPLLRPQRPRGTGRTRRVVSRSSVRHALHLASRRLVDENEVVAPIVGTLIAVEPRTSHLTLRGFILESCTGEAVVLNRTSDCTIAGCTIRGVGDYTTAR